MIMSLCVYVYVFMCVCVYVCICVCLHLSSFHMQMAKEKQSLLLVTFEKLDKARFECYLLIRVCMFACMRLYVWCV